MSSIALRPIKPSDVAIPMAGYKATFLNIEDNDFLYQKDEFGNITKLIGDTSLYVHDQTVASSIWTINHGLNTYPSISVVDSAGTKVFGDEKYLSPNSIEITFTAPFGGKAYLVYGGQ